jgi:dolichol-phosphate mannosyltransferase
VPEPANAYPPIVSVLVCIPTYNERENLASAIAGVRAAVPSADILVLDDNSPDGTGALAEEIAAADPHVRVLHRTAKEGLGRAYLAGFEWGLERGYDAIVEMDADGSHRPAHLPALLAAAAQADLVIGSRYVRGGEVVNWPRRRKLLSVGGNVYTRVLLGMPVKDATAGFRVYRAGALRALDLDSVASEGYCFQVDLTRRAVARGMVVREVPITFVERELGDSKMNQDVATESLKRITRWGVEHRTRQARRITGRETRWHAL